jgi:amino acid adenylation domain-containing protein
MSKGAFTKSDIESVYKTHFAEQSLIVLQTDEAHRNCYTETAILCLPKHRLTPSNIHEWARGIDRFRDVYIYQKTETPLRVRLKQIDIPLVSHAGDAFDSLEMVSDWVDGQNISFDIQRPPLFNLFLLEGPNHQYLVIAYHHLLFDGNSIQLALSALENPSVVTGEEWMPPTAQVDKQPIPLPSFLLQNLVPAPAQGIKGHSYFKESFQDKSYLEVMELWVQFLSLASGSDNITVGEVFSMRGDERASQQALGYFVQTWPLSFQHAENIQQQLERQRGDILSHFQAPVNNHFQGVAFDHCWVVEPGLQTSLETLFRSKPHFVLSLVIQPQIDGCDVTFVWNLEKVLRESASEIVASFVAFCQAKAVVPTHAQSFPKPTYDLKSLVELWSDKVKTHGTHTAIREQGGRSYTYGELDELSDRLAQSLDIRPQDTIGVSTTFSAHLVVSYLAILKKRGIYVPLDPMISEERRNYITGDSGMRFIISDLPAAGEIPHIHPIQQAAPTGKSSKNGLLEDICYLIYTSGTTGNPKGCAVTNANLANLFEGSQSLFEFKDSDNWILAHSYGFDFSTWEIWGALLNGACLFIPSRDAVKDTFEFYRLLQQEKITILNQTPKSFDNLMLVGEGEAPLSQLRYLIFGGDKLLPEKIQAWRKQHPWVKPVNMYGITETTVHVTFREIQQETLSQIGKPLPGYAMKTVNPNGMEVPNGFLGEFHVMGLGVCKGYFGKPDLTAEKFSHAPEPLYRTGDVGWQMGGEFFYAGRNDRQVKIRGYRIELGEIEFTLRRHFPGVSFAALFIAQLELVAFHTAGHEIMRIDVQGLLPDYAVPTRFIQIPAIPLNVNGKIDEKALIEIHRSYKTADNAPQAGDLMPYLTQILGAKVDANKSFIENGGDSISAIRLVNNLKRDGLKITLQDLFSGSPVASLTLSREANKSNSPSWKSSPELQAYNQHAKLPAEGVFNLLSAQQGILFETLAKPAQGTYHEQLTYEFGSQWTTQDIVQAYEKVMDALPALRLTLQHVNQVHRWVLLQSRSLEINVEKAPDHLENWLQIDFKRPFDLTNSLIRLSILEHSDGRKTIVWTHHHLLMDGWSLGIFSNLLVQALQHQPLRKQEAYLHFLYEQGRHVESESTTYWEKRIGQQALEPLIPFLPDPNSESDHQSVLVDIPAIPAWADMATRGITPNMFTFTAWVSFLSSAFGKSNLCPGWVVSLRQDQTMDEVGMLIKTLPFPIEIDPTEAFSHQAAKVKELFLADDKHKMAPLDNLQHCSFNLGHLFVFENYPFDADQLGTSGIEIGAYSEKTGADWTLVCYPHGQGIRLKALFNPHNYQKDYADAILKRFGEFVQHISWDSNTVEILNNSSRQGILKGKQADLSSFESILDLFKRESVQAAMVGGSTFSYSDLWERADHLATRLKQAGLQPHEAVGIDVQSTLDFVVSILAAWQCGCVPCPVDHRYPDSRKDFIWTNSGARFLLKPGVDNPEIHLVASDIQSHPAAASFILHTSGSTGVPKGVIQSHDCLIHLADWTSKALGLTGNERILALSSFGFDASFHEVMLSLTLGATLVEIQPEHRQDIHRIREAIQHHGVTLAWIPARLLNSILEIDADYFAECHSLRQIVTTGEALIISEALAAWVKSAGIRLLNFYGPTETHVVTCLVVDSDHLMPVPDIGFPVHNADIGLLDESGNLVLEGFPGEIWVAGPYLACGYLNDSESTQQKFVERNGIRWYKTGDTGRVQSDGHIRYLGRKDQQIKIRGFRVEPFEVENLLHALPEIDQAAVAVEKSPETRLVAFYTGNEMTDSQFRASCLKVMPDYMVPEVQVRVAELPRNINGKIDRSKLLTSLIGRTHPLPDSHADSVASECWRAVLGHDSFGPRNHFQSVGGNSIKLMRVQAWLEKHAGIALSIQELLQNPTLEQLDRLIASKKESTSSVELPSELPLNALQMEILQAEIGNYADGGSPYWLEFAVPLERLPDAVSLDEGIAGLFEAYPHLLFGLSVHERVEDSHWRLSDAAQEKTSIAPSSHSLSNGEPLLRLVRDGVKLRVKWHHILLDDVGINLAMNHLFQTLSGYPVSKKPEYSAFIQPSVRNRVEVKTSNQTAQIHAFNLDANTKNRLEEIAATHSGTLLKLILVSAHQIFAPEALIAFTDNSSQPGTPGMFTFLNASKRVVENNNRTKNLDKMVETGVNGGEVADVVLNFMHAAELPDGSLSLEAPLPSRCKYPVELQVVVRREGLDIQLILEQGSPLAAAGEKWMDLLVQLADSGNLDLLGSEPSQQSTPVFDDFDF